MASRLLRRLTLCNKKTRLLDNLFRSFHGSCYLSVDNHYDVIVSGGGMVGSAMAAALGYEPMFGERKVLLLEAGSPNIIDKVASVYQSRVCALSPGTVDLLTSFGAWNNVCNMRYKEVKGMQVWESCSDGIITFTQDQLTENLAYIVENDVILAAIMQQIDKIKDRVEVKFNAGVKRYQLADTGHVKSEDDNSHLARVQLEDGSLLSADLLIGADGHKSLLRGMAGFHTIKWDYNQFAVVATLKLVDHTDNSVAWQRFLPTGPIAMLPLSDEYSCLIWTTTPEEAENLMKLSSESFVDAINNAFWTDEHKDPLAHYASDIFDNILTTFGLSGSTSQQLPPTVIGVEENTRGRFPLSLCHSSQYVKSRVALIGDAAHRVHPLAGQGVNLGFGDVTCLCEHITKALCTGQDIGDLNHLLDYETERQRHVLPTMAVVDGLNRLYSTKLTPVVLLRTLGLQATNALTPLKEKMISHATS